MHSQVDTTVYNPRVTNNPHRLHETSALIYRVIVNRQLKNPPPLSESRILSPADRQEQAVVCYVIQ